MIRVVIILAVLAMAYSAPLEFQSQNSFWEAFKTTHKKTYQPEKESYRRAVFLENVQYVQKHNLEADMGKHSYWLGINEYSDFSNLEFRKFANGYRMNVNMTTGSPYLKASNTDLPTTVDWRTKGYVTPVKNQGQCGSCWAFSATGSLEGQHFRKTGQLVSLSEQQLVDCSGRWGNHGCNGGVMGSAFLYIKDNGGIDRESCYPYRAKQYMCHFRQSCVAATDSGYFYIRRGDENALLNAVATNGPVSVAIDASHRSFGMYRSGVYNEPECSSTRLDHGVLVVGYGTEAGHDYWLVKNSWGAGWGEQGYIKMSRNRGNQCGIATQASFPIV